MEKILRITNLSILSGYHVLATFDNGTEVIYDVAEDIDAIPDFAPLRDQPGLFEAVQVDQSRTCVYWNEHIDLPSDIIYEYGTKQRPALNSNS